VRRALLVHRLAFGALDLIVRRFLANGSLVVGLGSHVGVLCHV